MARLSREFYAGNTVEIARNLLGKILVRRLADGDMAVIRLNFRDHETSNAPTVITPDMLGLPEDCTARMQVTDLWTGEEIALVHGTIPNPGIPPHGCQVLRIHLHD